MIHEMLSASARKTVVYGRMIKFEHTIFALPFALAALLLALRQSPPVTLKLVCLIITAMVGARSAAMGFNRIIDAAIDARNPRTSTRELPSGVIGITESSFFVGASALLFVLSAFLISWTCFWSSFVVLVLLFCYSFTKRFTCLSHLVLGLVIGIAPLGVWVAITDTLSWKIALLSLALSAYIAGFDILYACQDLEFDRGQGLCSIPARFGARRALRISSLLHLLSFLALLSLYSVFYLTPAYLGFVIVIGILLIVEHRLVSPDDLSRVNVAFFHVNSVISVLLFVALLVEEVIRRWA